MVDSYNVRNVICAVHRSTGTSAVKFIPRYEVRLIESQFRRDAKTTVVTKPMPNVPPGSIKGSQWSPSQRFRIGVTPDSEWERLLDIYEERTAHEKLGESGPLLEDVYRTFEEFQAAFLEEAVPCEEEQDNGLNPSLDEQLGAAHVSDEEAEAIAAARQAAVKTLTAVHPLITEEAAVELFISHSCRTVSDLLDLPNKALEDLPKIGRAKAKRIKDAAHQLIHGKAATSSDVDELEDL